MRIILSADEMKLAFSLIVMIYYTQCNVAISLTAKCCSESEILFNYWPVTFNYP